jgi:uncharacterized protein (UPF0303 family)
VFERRQLHYYFVTFAFPYKIGQSFENTGKLVLSLIDDIARLKLQEEKLRFVKFDEADAWALGNGLQALAVHRNLPMVIDIRIGNRPLFYTALAGTTPENPDWVRRKINTVYRFHKSSYRVGREYEQKGNRFDQSRGIDPMEHANAGGSFPIHIIGTGVVGAVTVSGIPQRDDHNFVTEGIASFLKIDFAQIALGPEAP